MNNDFNDDFCPICGNPHGIHDYDYHGYSGSLGGSLGAKLVFGLFVIVSIPFFVFLPPLGAVIVAIGAAVTKV